MKESTAMSKITGNLLRSWKKLEAADIFLRISREAPESDVSDEVTPHNLIQPTR
jgi:hypothetical protein